MSTRMFVAGFLLALATGLSSASMVLRDFGELKNEGQSYRTDSMLEAVGHVMTAQDDGATATYTDIVAHVVVEVTVFKHGDVHWVEHELEGQYRSFTGFDNVVLVEGAAGTRRFVMASSTSSDHGGVVGWVSSGDTVVDIDYMGRETNVVLPQDIVDAYLALYPSSLPMSLADTPEHHTAWARDEMRRILEYGRRELNAGHTNQVEHWVKRFARLREFYYATDSSIQFEYELERLKLEIATEPVRGRPDTRLERALGDHLREFETWWAAHQNDPVLPFMPGATPRPRATLVRPKLPKAYQDVYDFVYRQQTAAATAATAVPTPPPPTP